MTTLNVKMDGFKQAFEDFMAHEAEFAVAEATRDHDSHKRLWLVLYDDGRYSLRHWMGQTEPSPVEVVDPEEREPHLAFPVEPLRADERNGASLEDSHFERPLEMLWLSYEQALQSQLGT